MLIAMMATMICCPAALGEERKKDAAEAVGEGNAAGWLEYYRRERGQQWDAKPGVEGSGTKPADLPDPREPARPETPPQPERR
jgi:hypothetical protein